jgi:hypothetical protein
MPKAFFQRGKASTGQLFLSLVGPRYTPQLLRMIPGPNMCVTRVDGLCFADLAIWSGHESHAVFFVAFFQFNTAGWPGQLLTHQGHQ